MPRLTTALLLIFTTFSSTPPVTAQALKDPVMDGETSIAVEGRTDAYLPTLFSKSHAANLLQAKNGDLWCTWMSGDKLNSILLSKRAKGSTTWTKPSVVCAAEAAVGFDNPVLFEQSNGTLWMFAAKEGHVVAKLSTDGAATWKDHAMDFGDKILTREPMVILQDGTWALSLYAAPTPGIAAGSESHHPLVALSSDKGGHWKLCEVPHAAGLVQPAIFSTGPKHYIALMRSRYSDWLYESESTDGCSWSDPRPTKVPSNNGSVELVKMRNGHVALAFDNTQASTEHKTPTAGKRSPLSVALSVDNGKTWPYVRDLDAATTDLDSTDPKIIFGKNEYSYPSITQTAYGRLAVAYTYRKLTIKVCEFPESWVMAGGTVGVMKPIRK